MILFYVLSGGQLILGMKKKLMKERTIGQREQTSPCKQHQIK